MAQMRVITFSLLFILQLSLSNLSLAQKTMIYADKDVDFKLGMELFAKEKYGAAQTAFKKVIASNHYQREVRIDAEFYVAICAFELFNEDTEFLLSDFLLNHPESRHSQSAYFHMGNFQYRKKKYKEAITYLEKVDPTQLSNTELSEYYFKLGYSYFIKSNYDAAKKLFFEIKDVDNAFNIPANYYYAHIAYLNKNYETALTGFKKLIKNVNFGPVVPYYIAQIYYLQGRYEEVINYAPGLLDSANVKRAPEIAHIIADSYYKKNNYKAALPYFETYLKQSGKISREDGYQIAYTYYKSADYNKAIEFFKKSIKDEDSLTQLSHYHLADCYIQLNNKKFARNSMQVASKLSYDPEIKEDASFNFAKLAFELSYNPYQEAITAFENYIELYPNSPRLDEAYKYLVNAYLTSKNYKDALISIEKIKQKSQEMQFAYQKIAYYRAVQLFNDLSFSESIENFNKAIVYPKDKSINALSHYWKGEACYRLFKYEEAINAFKEFLFEPGAATQPVFKQVNYNLGYAYFKLNDYQNAIVWFRKFVGTPGENNSDAKKLTDANTRIGDAYFINKDYNNAIDYYNQASNSGTLNRDYVLYQKSSAQGVLGKFSDKTETLNALINDFPKSIYADDSKYELANAYLLQNQNEKALEILSKLVDAYPNSSYVKKSLLKMALIYYNSDQNKLALELNKRIISDYPKSQEAREALSNMRTIYVETSNIAEFEDYLKTQSISISASALDSAMYEAAEARYLKSDFQNASRDFAAYLNKYPAAYFKLNATYYKAECDFKIGQLDEALLAYTYVSSQSKNNFTEKALLKTASLNFKKARYQESLNAYNKLETLAEIPANLIEARSGQMRSSFKLKSFENTINVSKKIIAMDKVSNELVYESHLTMAKSYLGLLNDSLALDEFQQTTKLTKSELGAEAKYNIAEIYFRRADYTTSEKIINEIINQVPSYDFWIAKSFILWADIYLALKDNFQAKATLQSIIDNADNQEIIQVAKEKLDNILKIEKAAEPIEKPDLIEIPFEESKLENLQLFNDSLIQK